MLASLLAGLSAAASATEGISIRSGAENPPAPAITAKAPAQPSGRVIGFWGDRSGIYPESNPPVFWDYDTGRNILWHAPTPTFGYGAPTLLKDRVVYLNEVDPAYPFPILVGLDLATGKECWRVEVNPLPVSIADPAKRKEIEELWRATIRWRGDFNVLLNDWKAATDKSSLAARLTKLGLKPDGNMTRKGYPAKDDAADPTLFGGPWSDPWRTLEKAGLTSDTWRYHCYGIPGGSWFFGETFATPISDGERVYIQLAWGVWAAYDRDGRLAWMQHLPSLAHGDYCQSGRSPLIWRDRLVADQGDWIRAFDRATGRQLWACSRKANKISQHEMESPMVVTVAGRDYVFGNSYPPIAVRLEDGKACPIQGPLSQSPGIIARTDPDRPDVLYLAGGGEHGGWENKGKADILPPAAIRLLPGQGDALKAEVLWHGVEGKIYGSQVSWMICHKGRLYFRDIILDAFTGKVLAGRPNSRNTPDQTVPGSTLTLAIAGGRIYGQGYAEHGSEVRKDDLGALVESEVYDLDGHRLAVNRLRGLPGQAAMRVRNNIPNWYNFPNNFTIAGDRILSRSCNEVICIGTVARAFNETELARIAPTLAGSPSLDTVLSHLESTERPVRLAAVQALASLGTAATPACPKLVTLLQSDQPSRAEAGFLALTALGPRAGPAAPDLAKLIVGSVPGRDVVSGRDQSQPLTTPQEQRTERARQALAAMGGAAVESLIGLLGDEAGYTAAMQTAALMEDFDAASQVFAHGMIEGKPPRFMPRLWPFVRYQELTLTHVIPEALKVRGWRAKAGAGYLLKALPTETNTREAKSRFLALAPIIAVADPGALVPRLDILRSMLKEKVESGYPMVGVLGRMGPLAAPALPDLAAWRAEPNLDQRTAAELDAIIAAIRATQTPVTTPKDK